MSDEASRKTGSELGLKDRWDLDIGKIEYGRRKEKAFYTEISVRISFISEDVNKF